MRFPYQTPNFNPYEDDEPAWEQSQSPVTDAFEASLNNQTEDTREGALEQEVQRADEGAANMQRMQGFVHAASQIGYGIAGADPRLIDPRAGSMFVDSELMRAKSARDTLERYHASQGARYGAARDYADMAGQDASFRAGRQDAAAQATHQNAAMAQDQSQFEASQRLQRQQMGMEAQLSREAMAQKDPAQMAQQLDPKTMATLQDPGMQQDVATLDGYLADGKNPPGVGMLQSRVPQMFKGDDAIRFQQAAQGAVMRLLTIRKKGAEPSAAEIQNFMNESGLLSSDPDTVRLGYQRVKAQLDGYNQMMKGQGGGGQDDGPDDWQDYQPGSGQGMFK